MSKFDGDFIQYSEQKVKNETKNLAVYFILHISLYIVLLFFAIFFVWYTVFVSTHSFYAVQGASMKYTLNSQILDGDTESSYDAVYVNRLDSLRDYDIVVLNREGSSPIIKRLMATEGDYITIAKVPDGTYRFFRIKNPTTEELANISDDEAMLDEESGELGYRIRGYSNWKATCFETEDIAVDVGGQTLVNRYEDYFYGTFLSYYGQEGAPYNYYVSANGLIYVQVPQGKVFCMGDNRGFSTDSRAKVNGFFDRTQIAGRTEFIVYNFNFGNRILEVVKFYFSEVEKFFAR
ncbi:MAG: S26 family signal peptidase [Candidatus Caccovivens sp.]